MTSALDKPVRIAIFDNVEAKTRESKFLSPRSFAADLREARAPSKAELRLFSCCAYGEKRTAKGSLRHDANVRECFCLVGDYDGEKVSLAEAADALKAAGTAAVLCTTPSYRNDRPRWRVIVPLSDSLHCARLNTAGLGLADYPKLVSRLAGVLPGGLAAESWTLSQGWYLGGLDGAVDHGTLLIEGDFIDLRHDLDPTARPKPAAKAKPQPNEQVAPRNTDAADEPALLDVADALAAIAKGRGAHAALVALAGKFASQGVPITTTEAVLLNAVDQRPEAGRDDGWKKMRGDVGRTVRWAYDKFAEQEAQYTALVATAQPHAGNGASPPPPPPPPGAGPGASPGTPPPQPGTSTPTRGMMRNRPPRFAGNLANVITALLMTPQLAGCVAFDLMALEISLRQPLPGDTSFVSPRPWHDDDTSRLQDVLQRDAQMSRVSKETVQQGVEHVARMHPFHPVRDYIAAQIWDGTPRIDTWLTTYLGVDASDYAAKTGRWWLIGMVARIMRPGCKFDYMLILEGIQGTLKSQTCVALCGPWVSDQSLDIRHDARAASQHLRNKWLVEVSELAFFRQADVETLKAFISRTHERYLPRYARNEVVEPRQCGFCGSTNNETYLHDPTGGRRFWPHRTGKIDIDALVRDRDQLWSEVVVAYRAGERWWPDQEFEATTIRPEQEARYEADAWAEPIGNELNRIKKATTKAQADWARLPEPKPPRPVARTTLMQVWQAALTDPNDPYRPVPAALKFDKSAQIRVREILQFLGWRRGRGSHGFRWWEWP